jgi:large subunit ribosomal protein L10
MALTRKQKTVIFDQLNTCYAGQKAVLLLTTKGCKATNSVSNHEFRSQARGQGVIVQVAKNTLIQKAFKTPTLIGQTYLAFMEDALKSDEVTVPKIIIKAVKKDFSDNFEILGCIVGGEFLSAEDAKKLADTPTFNDSMAMVAGSINQITAKLAIAIKEIPASVARGIKAAKAE